VLTTQKMSQNGAWHEELIAEMDSIDWTDDLVSRVVPLVQSAPPHGGSPDEAEELPRFPPRLPPATDRSQRRVRGKGFFITYSRTHLPRDQITQWFARQQRMKRFIVGQEHHQDGSLHWHVTAEYEVEKDVRCATYFNIDNEHPNIVVWTRAGGSTYDQWFFNHWEYCKKEDPTPFIQGVQPMEHRKQKRNEIFTQAIKLARETDVKTGMEYLEVFAPYDLLTKYEQIQRALMRLRSIAQQHQTPARSESDFRHVPLIPALWRNLYVHGPTDLGKTAWARSLLPEATVVSHRDQLRDCDFSKGVIFDDFDVGHWPPTAVIHLLDWDEPRGLDVKHGHVVIPAHTRKIFTHNSAFERWVSKDATDEQIAATRRRLYVVNIHSRMY